MYDWPVQASDNDLAAASLLSDELTAQGFVVVYDGQLCGPVGASSEGLLSAWDARVGLLRAGVSDVRYEPSGERQVADVTQVCAEVWVPMWVHAVVIAATHGAGLRRTDRPGTTREGVEAGQRRNVPAFAGYIAAAVQRLNTDEARNAVSALWRITDDPKAVHDFLFPDGWKRLELHAPEGIPLAELPGWEPF